MKGSINYYVKLIGITQDDPGKTNKIDPTQTYSQEKSLQLYWKTSCKAIGWVNPLLHGILF